MKLQSYLLPSIFSNLFKICRSDFKYEKRLYRQQYRDCQGVCDESGDSDSGLKEVFEPPGDGQVDLDHALVVARPLGAGHVGRVVVTHPELKQTTKNNYGSFHFWKCFCRNL